jgi:hypothetical protein
MLEPDLRTARRVAHALQQMLKAQPCRFDDFREGNCSSAHRGADSCPRCKALNGVEQATYAFDHAVRDDEDRSHTLRPPDIKALVDAQPADIAPAPTVAPPGSLWDRMHRDEEGKRISANVAGDEQPRPQALGKSTRLACTNHYDCDIFDRRRAEEGLHPHPHPGQRRMVTVGIDVVRAEREADRRSPWPAWASDEEARAHSAKDIVACAVVGADAPHAADSVVDDSFVDDGTVAVHADIHAAALALVQAIANDADSDPDPGRNHDDVVHTARIIVDKAKAAGLLPGGAT